MVENDATYFATQTISGCESQPFPVSVSVITEVEEYDLSLQYYPNPVKDNLTISFHNPLSLVVVKNILGQTLIVKEVDSNSTELRLTSFQSGVYFIQVGRGQRVMSFKIAKE
jgi:hypothetical protein